MNFLTIRQLEIANRFVIRTIYRMNEIIIDKDTSYCKELLIGDKCLALLLEYDGDGENDLYTSRISFTRENDDEILSKYYHNERITIEHWNEFLSDLRSLKICICEQYFKGDKDMKYCDDCEPYVIEHEDDCSICLINEPSRWSETPCKHEYHRHCLRTLYRYEGLDFKCPLCRFDIKSLSNIKDL